MLSVPHTWKGQRAGRVSRQSAWHWLSREHAALTLATLRRVCKHRQPPAGAARGRPTALRRGTPRAASVRARAGGRSPGRRPAARGAQDVVWERMDSVQNDTTFLRADMAPFAAPPERALADRAAAAAALAQAAFASVVPPRHGAPGALARPRRLVPSCGAARRGRRCGAPRRQRVSLPRVNAPPPHTAVHCLCAVLRRCCSAGGGLTW